MIVIRKQLNEWMSKSSRRHQIMIWKVKLDWREKWASLALFVDWWKPPTESSKVACTRPLVRDVSQIRFWLNPTKTSKSAPPNLCQTFMNGKGWKNGWNNGPPTKAWIFGKISCQNIWGSRLRDSSWNRTTPGIKGSDEIKMAIFELHSTSHEC